MKKKVLLLACALAFSFAAQANDSDYSPLELDLCAKLEAEANSLKPETESGMVVCPGLYGYKINVTSKDKRSWLVVVKNNQAVYDSMNDINAHITGLFAHIGGRVLEWRFDKVKKLIALIVRVRVQDKDDSEGTMSKLFVFRYENRKFCYLNSHRSNEGARQIADSQDRCPL